jgi:quinol monooxygenase YgiN
MPENALLKKVIVETYERNAVVGAVCHGPVSLLNATLSDGSYLVNGRNIASFTDEEEEHYAKADVPFFLQTALTQQGAIFHTAAPWSANSIADGNLVTGQNPASAKGVAEKMIAILEKPIYVFATWKVKEGNTEAVLDILRSVREESRKENGNLFYNIYQSNTDVNTLILSEGYADEAAINEHRNSAHYQELVAGKIVPLLENRQVVLTTQLTISNLR